MTQQGRASEVAIIAAMTRDRVIGLGAGLPWDLPEDLQKLKQLTTFNTVIMGRRTYESIGHPLPDRNNIVLSRSLNRLSGAMVCNSFITGMAKASQFGRPVFILGGVELYREALPIASVLHISWVREAFSGSVHFPEFDLADWRVEEEQDYPGFRYVKYLVKTADKSCR